MSDNRILSDEELGQIQNSVDKARFWGDTGASPSKDADQLIALFDYVKSLQERNTALGVAAANAEKHVEWDQHDAWAEGFAAGHLASRLTEDDNPFEERPR